MSLMVYVSNIHYYAATTFLLLNLILVSVIVAMKALQSTMLMLSF
jgi:hypothetical protein